MTVQSHLGVLVVCIPLGLASMGQVATAPVSIVSSRTAAQVFAQPFCGDLTDDLSTAYGTRTFSASIPGNVSTISVNWQDTGSGAISTSTSTIRVPALPRSPECSAPWM
jgi:hypothetical protein